MVRTLFITLLLLVGIAPLFSHAEELNAGFVQGLWYGTKTVVAGEPTRIYVALRNNTDNDLTGTVRFSDNGNRIGVSYVSALPGRLVEAWVDWTPRYGEHSITASLSDVRVYEIGQAPLTGEVDNTIAQDTLFVDYDTDKDGILNKEDTDDDNDTVSDIDEEKRGTDPLKANPIPKKEEPREESKSNTKDTSTTETVRDHDENTTLSARPIGLEQYVPNPTVKDAIESVTDTINNTRTSLDNYRQERADAIKEYFSDEGVSSSSPSSSASSTGNLATITRSRVEPKESFLVSVVDGGKALVSGIYSFVLWLISNALAHPAFLELVLLILVIYSIYRTARRYGRRRYDR